MEGISFGAIASIGLVAIIALSILVKTVKQRGTGAKVPPRPDTASDQNIDAAAKVLSAISTHTQSESGFQKYLENHSQDQLEDVPVYALAHFITASFSSPSRSKWLESVVEAVVPRGKDPELVNTAEYFWDVNEKWLFSETAFADFCAQYLAEEKDDWSPAVHERIILVGLAALASRDSGQTTNPEDQLRVANAISAELRNLSADFFGAGADQKYAELSARAESLAPEVKKGMAVV